MTPRTASRAAALAAVALLAWAPALPADHGAPHREGAVPGAFGDGAGGTRHDPMPPAALAGVDGAAAGGDCPALLDHRVEDIRGRTVDLCAFAGRVLLVVNTASQCGFTPQYEDLEALHERYREEGLVVMGFPSNDFGGQEPGDNADIAEFCEENYGVRFPMFAKVTVRGADQLPFFAGLTATRRRGVRPGEIRWNFEKFLLDREGELVGRYRSRVEPTDRVVVAALESALQTR